MRPAARRVPCASQQWCRGSRAPLCLVKGIALLVASRLYNGPIHLVGGLPLLQWSPALMALASLAAFRLYNGPPVLLAASRLYNGPPFCCRPPAFTMLPRFLGGLSPIYSGHPLCWRSHRWRPSAFTMVPRFVGGLPPLQWSPGFVGGLSPLQWSSALLVASRLMPVAMEYFFIFGSRGNRGSVLCRQPLLCPLEFPFAQVQSCCNVARGRQSHLDPQLRSNARERKEALGCFTSGARGWSIRSATVAVCLGRILQLSIQCSDGLRRSASRSRCGGNRGLTSTGGSRLRRQQARVLTAKMLLMFGRAVFRRWGIPAWRGPFESGAGNVAALLQPFFFFSRSID